MYLTFPFSADFKRGPLIPRDNQISMESEGSQFSKSSGDGENQLPDSKGKVSTFSFR